MSKIALMGSWAVPADSLGGTDSTEARNRQANIHRAIQLRRIYIQMPLVGGAFSLDDTDVLCEGVSFREQMDVCARSGDAVSICLGLSQNGAENGRDYHGSRGGRSAWPVISDDGVSVAAAARVVIRYAQSIGLEVWGVEAGNEESYQPSLEVPWSQFESAYLKTLRKIETATRNLLGPGPHVISGGQSSQAELHGHRSINQAIVDAGLRGRIVGAYHGNNEPDSFFAEGVEDLFTMGFLSVVVNEDKPHNNGPNRLTDRAIIAFTRGCLACAVFDCRNVDYNGQNGCTRCSWRVSGDCGAVRDELSVLGCLGVNLDRWDEIEAAAKWSGTWQGGSAPLLPWVVEEDTGPDPIGWDKYTAMLAAEAAGNEPRRKFMFDEWRKKWSPEEDDDTDRVKCLATLVSHVRFLRAGLLKVRQELETRSVVHDLSKLSMDEFDGFSEINATAREHPHGSAKYKASMVAAKKPGGCIDRHFSRNSHHPEFHEFADIMGWLDIVEMVCDWNAAAQSYGTNTLREALPRFREQHGFSREQWWLIEQVIDFLDPAPEAPND